jgi:hypothetical protein
MNRGRLLLDAIYPTVLLWLVCLAVALWRDADWPETTDAWTTFALLWLVVEFLVLKALLMARRMDELVWLTVSLVAANLAFAAVYLVVMAGVLWPAWSLRHTQVIRWSTRIGLATVLMWSIYQLVSVPPPAPLDRDEP